MKIGTTGDYPPFSIYNPETNDYEGFDIELIRAVAAVLGWEIEFVKTSWPQFENDLADHKFEVFVGGLTLTSARQERFLCSDPVTFNGKTLLVHQDNKDRFIDFTSSDIAGHKFITNPGGTNEHFVLEHLKHADLLTVDDIESIFTKLENKEVDAFVTDYQEAVHRSAHHPLLAYNDSCRLTEDSLGFLLTDQGQDLVGEINTVLDTFKQDGQLDAICTRWNIACVNEPSAYTFSPFRR